MALWSYISFMPFPAWLPLPRRPSPRFARSPQGNYPVVREDASQMCALQVQAEHASTLMDREEQLLACIEKYITKQVGRVWVDGGCGWGAGGWGGGSMSAIATGCY